MRSPPILECLAVTRRWRPGLLGAADSVDALSNISLTLRAREILAVVGGNGSGKTTLLLVASGRVTPSEGLVQWCGRDHPLAARPQLLAAKPWEYSFLTVRQALAFHAEILATTDAALPAPTRYVPLLHEVGLRGKARAQLGALSALDKLRVVVAQALLSRPRLLCFDEPFVFCSAAERRQGAALMRTLADRGMAVIIAGRDADGCGGQGVADKVLYLVAGRAVDQVPQRRSVLELSVVSAEDAMARLLPRLPSVARRGERVRIPIDERSPEALLALCRDAGVQVRASRVAEEPVGEGA